MKEREEGEGGTKKRKEKKNTPKHSCPLAAVCGSTTDCARTIIMEGGLLGEYSGAFCLLHHLLLLKGAFDLCIHLNSKRGKKKYRRVVKLIHS